ncbi:hypothetical protein [Pseudomonas aeruginosa]|uniref:hypothetical protein n=1 Tax=Pseudomonas aeruginosa TaxID=287 RepID=UPI0015897EC9|nr:hypothetical protein [Pseudomonas aeruginosa]
MSIDWNTAPEGATHWEPTGPDFYEGWMKKEGTDWFYWSESGHKWINGILTCDVSAEREATFEARPQEALDGQGLPPVGTVCEWHESDGWAYTESKVVAYTDDGLFVCMQKQGRRPEVLRIDNCDFRPIRTPEQIAAAERWAAIQQMLAFADVKYGAGELMSPKEYVETAVAALYDAGYRRQESST